MSDGNVIVDLYRYSGDVHNANGIVSKMQFAHNVNNLLLHNRKIIKNGTEQFIDRIRYNYYLPNKENGSLFKVSNIEYYSPKDGFPKPRISTMIVDGLYSKQIQAACRLRIYGDTKVGIL